ncbi:MAG: hypothetical protein HZA22_11670 [Nitrospirae bacterium]|nr:hypothetical protein [Nitrospirota bacterium]MBI5696348.1 hypothetical protein [Nitrospirota bacterium]
MSNLSGFLKLLVIAGVFVLDHRDPPGQVGLFLAVVYIIMSGVSLFSRDWPRLRKRGFLVTVFVLEQIVVNSLAESPPHFELFDKLQKLQ